MVSFLNAMPVLDEKTLYDVRIYTRVYIPERSIDSCLSSLNMFVIILLIMVRRRHHWLQSHEVARRKN